MKNETKKIERNVVKTNNLADIMFDVEKVNFPGGAISEYSHQVFAHVKGEKILVNSCSDRYELVPVASFLPQVRNLIFNTGMKFRENYKVINHSIIYFEYVIEDNDFYIGNPKDKLQMRIFGTHSYNGQVMYSLNMGTFYRVLCSNGLWMTVFDTKKHGLSISGKHTQKINTSLSELQNKLKFVLENDVMLKASKVYQPLYDNWVKDWNTRLIETMEVVKIGQTTNNVSTIESIIRTESAELYGGDVNNWLIYNGINNFLFNDNNNVMIEPERIKKDRQVLETLLELS